MMYLGKLTSQIFGMNYFEQILNGEICSPQLKQSVVGKPQSIKSYHYFFFPVLNLWVSPQLVPIDQNRSWNLADSNNYIPISIATFTFIGSESVILV